jgi:hypothetical protein
MPQLIAHLVLQKSPAIAGLFIVLCMGIVSASIDSLPYCGYIFEIARPESNYYFAG